jgi:hypothetical protein
MARNNFKGYNSLLQDSIKNTPGNFYKVLTQGSKSSKVDRHGGHYHSPSNFGFSLENPGANLPSTSRTKGQVPLINSSEVQDKPRLDNKSPQKPSIEKKQNIWTHLKMNSRHPADQTKTICSSARGGEGNIYFSNIGGNFDTHPDSLMEVKCQKRQDKVSDRILPVVNNKLGGTMRAAVNSKGGLLSKKFKTRQGPNSNSFDCSGYMTAMRKNGIDHGAGKALN